MVEALPHLLDASPWLFPIADFQLPYLFRSISIYKYDIRTIAAFFHSLGKAPDAKDQLPLYRIHLLVYTRSSDYPDSLSYVLDEIIAVRSFLRQTLPAVQTFQPATVEIRRQIARYLSTTDFFTLRLASRNMACLFEDQNFWKSRSSQINEQPGVGLIF